MRGISIINKPVLTFVNYITNYLIVKNGMLFELFKTC